MKNAMRKILLVALCVLLLATVAGCKQEQKVEVVGPPLNVSTLRVLPKAYQFEEYDLREIINMEDGVTYSATACYVEQKLDEATKTYTLETHPIEVVDLCFVPKTLNDTEVTITATRGKETASKKVSISTIVRADPLDDLYKASGPLGFADVGITKSVNTNKLYIQGENSATSLQVKFSGKEAHDWGNIFMELSHPSAQAYFTDQIWDNAIVTFWVYNPMEQDIEFQLTVNDKTFPVMLDWTGEEGNFRRQFAKAGEWTQIFFSLRRMGTTHKLVTDMYSTESVCIKFQYAGYSTTQEYEMEFYLDNLDVVPASMYPDVDTTYIQSNETLEQGWENMPQDTGWQGANTIYVYDEMYGEDSTCSLYATFDSKKGVESPFVVLNPEMMLGNSQMPELPDMTGGTLTAYFKFENAPAEVKVDLVKVVGREWQFSNMLPMQLVSVGNGWYKGTLDVYDFDLGTERNDEITRIRFTFSGITKSSKVWIDTVKFDYKNAVKVRESVDKDWINMPTDSGMTKVTAYQFDTDYKKAEGSVRSMKITAPSSETGVLTISPDYALSNGDLKKLPNMTKGVIKAYFYFGKQSPSATMRLYNKQWSYCRDVEFIFENVGEGWYLGTIPVGLFTGYPSGDSSAILRISIMIPAGYTVYVDGLMHYPDEVYKTKFDANDLFHSGVFTTIGFDGKSGVEIVKDVTNASADAVYMWAQHPVGWPEAGIRFALPVDISQYSHLSVDAKTVNAHKWLALKIYYLDSNGVEKTAEVGMDFASNDWETHLFKLSRFAKADLTKVTGITVVVNFGDSLKPATTNQFWVDNLKLVNRDDDVANTQLQFEANKGVFMELDADAYTVVSFEYKLSSAGTMAVILRSPQWLEYYGDYNFDANGLVGVATGVACEPLSDGYVRVTMTLPHLNRTGCVDNRKNAPSTVGIFDIYSALTTASGTVRNLQLSKTPVEPLPPEETSRGEAFTAGATKNIILDGEATKSVTFEYKLKNEGQIHVILRAPDWVRYYGDFAFNSEGEVDDYRGITTEKLDDGYIRVTMLLNQLRRSGCVNNLLNAPATVGVLDIYEWGTASGYVDNIQLDTVEPTEPDEPSEPSDPSEPGEQNRGEEFLAGWTKNVLLSGEATKSLAFEYKLKNEGQIHVILRAPDWVRYYGDFAFNGEGEVDDYRGITTERLDDGYIRVTVILSQLERSGCVNNLDNAPASVGVLDIYEWGTASGYVDNIQLDVEVDETPDVPDVPEDPEIPSEPEKPEEPNEPEKTFDPENIFASGEIVAEGFAGDSAYEVTTDALHVWTNTKIGWPTVGVSFSSPVDISAYDDIALDVKVSNTHKWLSIKIGYLSGNGVEVFSEVGADFVQEDWQTVTMKLSQFNGADLTKVTKILVCMNLETNVSAGVCNEVWLDNLKVLKAETEESYRGQLFEGGKTFFVEMKSADYESISFEYKLVTDGTMTLILRDSTWLKYFGDYIFTADGAFSDYAGVTTEKLSDGYVRVTMVMDELIRSGLADNRDNAPETLAIFDIYTTTTANGYVDAIGGVEREVQTEKTFDPEDIFASGEIVAEGFAGDSGYEVTTDALHVWTNTKIGWPTVGVSFSSPVDISAYENIALDVKVSNTHKWLSIKIGYLNGNGVEVFSEVGADFVQEDWQTVTMKLSQFNGADLTKVTKILVCMNLETNVSAGVCNEVWLDNLKVTKQEEAPEEPVGMQLSFQANTNAFLTFEDQACKVVQFDYKLESAGEMYIILRDATWLKYFGDYAFNAEGEVVDYAGVTTQKRSNGYIRVTMILDELERTGCNNNRDIAPQSLAVFDVFGTTTVNGNIQNLQFLNEVPASFLEKLAQNVLRCQTELA